MQAILTKTPLYPHPAHTSRAETNPQTLWKQHLAIAVLEGCTVWLAYNALEFMICVFWPLLADSLSIVTPTTLKWFAVFVGAYLVAGATSSTLATVILWFLRHPGKTKDGLPGRVAQHAGAVGLGITNILGVLRLPGSHHGILLLLGAIIATLAAVCTLDRVHRYMKEILRPWPVALLFVALPIVGDLLSTRPAVFIFVGCAAPLGVVVLAVWTFSHIRRSREARGGPVSRFATALAVNVILVCLVWLLSSYRILDRSRAARLLSGSTTSRPNVVFLTLDTVRADHTSLGNYYRDTTPGLRLFANEAVVYRNLIAASNYTLPTHATMFTGLYPRQHGAIFRSDTQQPADVPLAGSFETLANVLRSNGYATVGVAANSSFLTPSWGLTKGFEVYDVHSVVPIDHSYAGYVQVLTRRLLSPFAPTQGLDRLFRPAEEINADAFALLEAMKRKSVSFFLFVNYMDAHAPYSPPQPFDRKFPGRDPALTAAVYETLNGTNITASQRQALLSQYDGAIAYEDCQVARLLQKLKELELYDNTLILITADHGEQFGDHGLMNHRRSLYQSLIHVPLVIKYPGSHKAAVVDVPVSQIDFMPTILAAVGLRASAGLLGVDLRTVAAMPPRQLMSFGYAADGVFGTVERALVAGGFKYIDSLSGKRQLFNLTRDSDELENLYRADDPLSRAMRVDLSEWLKKVPSFHVPGPHVDEENLRRLKTLGYVQ